MILLVVDMQKGIVDEELVWQIIQQKLGSKPKLLPLNKQAYEAGLELGKRQRIGA